MTAALGNTSQGTPFATGVDAFVYPQYIGYAMRPPTTQDVYNPGTHWQDNSINPPVIYITSGAGIWLSASAGSLSSLNVTGPTTLTGTTNINTTGSAVTTIGTGGTGAVNIGNATGNTSVTGALTASGTITTSNGNFVLGAAGDKNIYGSLATTTAAGANAAGTVTLVGGTATITTTAISAISKIRMTRQSIGATGAAALGELSVGTISAGVSFVINSVQTASATSLQATDVSVIFWEIVN